MPVPDLDPTKADFTDIYTESDPRSYYRTLAALDYQITANAAPYAERVLKAAPRDGVERTVLDVCCSYGVNAALLRGSTHEELIENYLDPGLDNLEPQGVLRHDQQGFGGRASSGRTVRGLDISEPAIDYATAAGLLSDGWAEDLEQHDPSPGLVEGIRDTGLVLSTGAVGYVTDRTYRRILGALDRPDDVWLLSCVLRMYSFDSIAEACAEHELLTEKLPGVLLRQRRFADRSEADAAVKAVRDRGFDTTGAEDDGWYLAEVFLTRPRTAVEALSAERLFEDLIPAT